MALSNERFFPPITVEHHAYGPALRLHPSTAHRLELSDVSSVRIVCSDRMVLVDVRQDERVSQSTVVLPMEASKHLSLDSSVATRLKFRMKRTEDRLEMGPVIGILAKVTAHEQPRARDHGYKIINAVWNVENLGGLVYFFSPDGIDWNNRTVRGFVHIPGKVDWETGIFPFPKAIYRRIAIPATLEEKLKQTMTPHLFNPVSLGNKLVQHNLLSENPTMRPHLPDTLSLKDEASVQSIVRRYGRAYVKNTHKGAGAGVFRLERRKRGGYRLRLRHRDDSKRGSPEKNVVVADFRQFIDLATGKVGRPWTSEHWLVQQPIALARYRGRPFDVRVNVQKDGQGRWCIPSHVVRIAPDEDSAVTRRGTYRSIEPVVEELWPRRCAKIIREVDAVSIQACRFLETKLGLMGDVGVDIALDEQGRSWFIEANPRPSHVFRIQDQLETTFWRKVFNPLIYASHLSGFPLNDEDVPWPKKLP